MDTKKILLQSGMVAVGVGGLAHLLTGLTGTMPDTLSNILNWGIQVGGYNIGVQAVAGALSLYIAGLYAKRYF